VLRPCAVPGNSGASIRHTNECSGRSVQVSAECLPPAPALLPERRAPCRARAECLRCATAPPTMASHQPLSSKRKGVPTMNMSHTSVRAWLGILAVLLACTLSSCGMTPPQGPKATAPCLPASAYHPAGPDDGWSAHTPPARPQYPDDGWSSHAVPARPQYPDDGWSSHAVPATSSNPLPAC
jgi:hypothetical protein